MVFQKQYTKSREVNTNNNNRFSTTINRSQQSTKNHSYSTKNNNNQQLILNQLNNDLETWNYKHSLELIGNVLHIFYSKPCVFSRRLFYILVHYINNNSNQQNHQFTKYQHKQRFLLVRCFVCSSLCTAQIWMRIIVDSM